MLIRSMEQADVPAAARLLSALAEEFIVQESPPEGRVTFLRENDEEGLRGYLASGFVYHVALVDGEIAGFIAVRDRTHLFQLFVDKRWHGRGVARALWEVARRVACADGHPGVRTVNASNYAVPVYEAFGFVRTGPTQFRKGVYFNPMELPGQAAAACA